MAFNKAGPPTNTPLQSQISTHSEKQRFVVLDIFRGIFAFFVFLFHLRPFADTPIIRNSFVDNCDLFVDFFFVLSGFVIALNYLSLHSGKDVVNFIKKRFRRIYPLHLFMLLLFLLVAVVKPLAASYVHVNNLTNTYDNTHSYTSSLLLLNSTHIMVDDVSWNIASWSISAEMIAYLTFATAIYFTKKIYPGFKFLYITIAVIIASVIAMRLITGTFLLDYTFDYGYVRGIIGFFTGILCYYVYQLISPTMKQFKNSHFSIIECVLLALLGYMIYYGRVFKTVGLSYELLFFICIVVFSMEKGFISRSLKKSSFLNSLGKYSYSIYLTHTLMISLFNIMFIRILKLDPSAYSYLFILNFALIYVCSTWTYKHIEMKFYHFRRK